MEKAVLNGIRYWRKSCLEPSDPSWQDAAKYWIGEDAVAILNQNREGFLECSDESLACLIGPFCRTIVRF